MSLNSRGNLSWNDDVATGWSRSNFYAIFSVNRYANCVWLLHKYEAHMKGLPICFSEVQVKNDVTDNNNKHFVTAFEGECRIYHRAARAFKALLSHHSSRSESAVRPAQRSEHLRDIYSVMPNGRIHTMAGFLVLTSVCSSLVGLARSTLLARLPRKNEHNFLL